MENKITKAQLLTKFTSIFLMMCSGEKWLKKRVYEYLEKPNPVSMYVLMREILECSIAFSIDWDKHAEAAKKETVIRKDIEKRLKYLEKNKEKIKKGELK